MGLKLSKEYYNNNVDPTVCKSMVVSLMYLTITRFDLMYVVRLVSRFMETQKQTHWLEVKRILRYDNGTKGYDILYTTTNEFRLVRYTDSD